MTSKEEETYRFAVGTADGPRSPTWRIWVEKDSSIYIGPRDLGGWFKVSLHPGGYWRLEGRRIGPRPGDRLYERFTPAEVRPGVRRGVTIMIPWLAVHQPRHGSPEVGNVHWLPVLAERHLAEVILVVGAPGTGLRGPQIIAENQLANGSTTWLVYRSRVALPTEVAAWTDYQRQCARAEAVRAARDGTGDILGVLVGDAPDGGRFLLDVTIADQ